MAATSVTYGELWVNLDTAPPTDQTSAHYGRPKILYTSTESLVRFCKTNVQGFRHGRNVLIGCFGSLLTVNEWAAITDLMLPPAEGLSQLYPV